MAAIYTFNDLQDQVLANLDETGDTGTTLTLVKNFLNQAMQMRCAQEPWPFLRWDSAETFSLVADDRFYALHQEFWRPDYFFNRDTKEFLIEVPQRAIASTGERWTVDTGRTPYFRWAGVAPVATQPTSASVITIVSSSASDTTAAKAITVDGITSTGIRTTESITPNGLTGVPGTTSFVRVLAVTKAADWVGTMTMTSNSGVVTLLSLLPAEYGRQYRTIELLRSPTQTDTIEYVFYRQPRKLVNDNDIPDIPAPHMQILVWDALLLFAGYNTEINGQAVKIWASLQADMEADMRRLWLEGTSSEAHPRFIRQMGDESGYPRVFSRSEERRVGK